MSKQSIHNHIGKIRNNYCSDILYPEFKNTNIQKCWLNTHDLSPAVLAYIDLTRLVAELYHVRVYRDKFTIAIGYYLVGNYDNCKKVIAILQGAITRVETLTSRKIGSRYNRTLYRSQCIIVYCRAIRRLMKDFYLYQDKNRKYSLDLLLDIYVKEDNHLSTLKKLNPCQANLYC